MEKLPLATGSSICCPLPENMWWAEEGRGVGLWGARLRNSRNKFRFQDHFDEGDLEIPKESNTPWPVYLDGKKEVHLISSWMD